MVRATGATVSSTPGVALPGESGLDRAGPTTAKARLGVWWPLLLPAGLVSFLGWRPATQGPTTCPFAIVTGVACPLCGGTRAAAALVEGDLSLAWEMHPIIFVVLPAMVYGYYRWLRTRAGHRPISAKAVNRAMTITGLLLLVIWVVRGLTGTLPPV